MPVRKVINRPLLRSQRLIWRETRGQTAYRTKDLFFFPTRVLELFFFFCPPPIAGQRPKKVATNGESMGQQAGLINSVTALHGRVSFRSAICHVPKGTYKQNEAVSAQFMHDPRTWSISFYFQCLFSIRSFEVWIYWNGIFLFFFFLENLKRFYMIYIYLKIIVSRNKESILEEDSIKFLDIVEIWETKNGNFGSSLITAGGHSRIYRIWKLI